MNFKSLVHNKYFFTKCPYGPPFHECSSSQSLFVTICEKKTFYHKYYTKG